MLQVFENMKHELPKPLLTAIANGDWKNREPEVLRHLFESDLPDLKLFEDVAEMERVASQLDAAGFVDDPEFCMVRNSSQKSIDSDPRLVFENALFIAGSIVPGDDVFVAIDLTQADSDPQLLIFDWNEAAPARWVVSGTLGRLIHGLSDVRQR